MPNVKQKPRVEYPYYLSIIRLGSIEVVNFLDFPEELLLKICSYLPITAVLTHKIVSKGLKKIMEKFIRSLFSDEKNRKLILSDNRYKMTDAYQYALDLFHNLDAHLDLAKQVSFVHWQDCVIEGNISKA